MSFNPTVDNNHLINKSSIGGRIFVYLSFIFIIPIILYIVNRNSLISRYQRIQETASGIDVQLKRRIDMLTKLVDVTKNYIKYEKDMLTEITNLRMQTQNIVATQNINRSEIDNEIDLQWGRINALMENYPDLKVSQPVMQLQAGIKDCEDNIAAARRFYNSEARIFNEKLQRWPSNVTAYGLNYQPQYYFENNEFDRQDIAINLGV